MLAFLRRYGDETHSCRGHPLRALSARVATCLFFGARSRSSSSVRLNFPASGATPILESGTARFLLVSSWIGAIRPRARSRSLALQRRSFTGGRRKLGKHSGAGRRRLPGRNSPGLSAAPALVPRPAKFHQVSPDHRALAHSAAGRHPYRAGPHVDFRDRESHVCRACRWPL